MSIASDLASVRSGAPFFPSFNQSPADRALRFEPRLEGESVSERQNRQIGPHVLRLQVAFHCGVRSS
jgi:hypothetical protein